MLLDEPISMFESMILGEHQVEQNIHGNHLLEVLSNQQKVQQHEKEVNMKP
jgi:hypothetical protein